MCLCHHWCMRKKIKLLEGVFYACNKVAARLRIPAIAARITHIICHIRIHAVKDVVQLEEYVHAFNRLVVQSKVCSPDALIGI